MERVLDKRILKTKKAIHSALTRKLTVKPIEEITVTELAEEAEINRKTFYNYYNSVYMVAEEMEDEIVERFDETLRKTDFETMLKDPDTMFKNLANLILSDLSFYGNILTNRSQSGFLLKLIGSLKLRIVSIYADQVPADDELFNYVLEYSVAGIVAVLQRWLETGRKTDIDTLSRQISALSVFGISGLLQKEAEECTHN